MNIILFSLAFDLFLNSGLTQIPFNFKWAATAENNITNTTTRTEKPTIFSVISNRTTNGENQDQEPQEEPDIVPPA